MNFGCLFAALALCGAAIRVSIEGGESEAKKKISVSLIGANCNNIIRFDGVLGSLARINCGKFADQTQYETRIFGTGRNAAKANIWPKWEWEEAAQHDGCSVEQFKSEVTTLVVSGPDDYPALNAKISEFDGGNGIRIFYFCMPPSRAPEHVKAVSRHVRANSPDLRFMMEKPIGTNGAAAIAIERDLASGGVQGSELYMVDHFLGEPMIDILTEKNFRGTSTNAVLNRRNFDKKVVVVQDESRDLNGRVASFFEGVGQVRDITQSHLLQMLACAALPPGDIDIGQEKANLLQQTTATANQAGQYYGYLDQLTSESQAKGRTVDLSALTVATATFSNMTFNVNTDVWRGVPWELKTGKNMAVDNWLVRYESTSGCNVLVNIWGKPAIPAHASHDEAENYWIALENSNQCSSAIKSWFLGVVASYGGTRLETGANERRYKINPTVGGLPAYANIFSNVAEGSRDRVLDFAQVNAQWASLEQYIDQPPAEVMCYNKCPEYTEALASRGPPPQCPMLGDCPNGASVQDQIAAKR